MLWIKALHVVFVITWFAGLFYLPRLFVYHALATDAVSNERFKIMERKLYYGIMTPSAVLALISGLTLWLHFGIGSGQTWLLVKLALVLVLLAYHLYCAILLGDFKHDRNHKSHVWFRWFNEAPVPVLAAIVILVVVRPWL